MKLLAPLFLTSLTFTQFAAAAEPNSLTADQIIAKTTQTYRDMKTFRGSCKVTSKSVYLQNGKMEPLDQTASASFDFNRGTSFLIKGTDTSGDPFTIDNRGTKTTLTTNFHGETEVETTEDIEMAVAAMTGVAASAPTTIPALLLDGGWGFPFRRGATSELKKYETLEGRDCFLITQTFKDSSCLESFWIDSESFLLRQSRSQSWPEKMDGSEARDWGGIWQISSNSTKVYTIED